MRFTIIIVMGFLLSIGIGTSVAQSDDLAVPHDPADIDRLWESWQERYVEPVIIGDNVQALRVVSDAETQVTFSEGQAYGMLFAALLDEPAIFEQLWLYAEYYLNTNSLMSWHIASDGSVIDEGAATDADFDMAMALIYGCRRLQLEHWETAPQDTYCSAARAMIDSIWLYEVDKTGNEPSAGLTGNQHGYEIIPGDQWCLSCEYPNGITNLSYFAPAYFPFFAQLTDNADWQAVTDRNYDILERIQASECSGLVPNWNTYDGDYQRVSWQGESSMYWGWDAARVAWRLALSRYWHEDQRATTALNTIGGFFTDIGLNNVRAEYRLDGTPVNDYRENYFTAMAASAIWGMETPRNTSCEIGERMPSITRERAFRQVVRLPVANYYNDSWQLLTLMLMGGYFTHPEQAFLRSEEALLQATPTSPPATVAPVTPFPTETPPSTSVATATQPSIPLSTIVDVQLKTTVVNNQQAQMQVRVTNITDDPLENISLQLFINLQDEINENTTVLTNFWDSSGNATISDLQPYQIDVYFWEISLVSSLEADATAEIHLGLNMDDWAPSLDVTNDWWYTSHQTMDDFVATPYIPVYSNSRLISGALPPS
ncbi:MAG: glycosyl hydrolase family 8 [Chloroflexota bacterium]